MAGDGRDQAAGVRGDALGHVLEPDPGGDEAAGLAARVYASGNYPLKDLAKERLR